MFRTNSSFFNPLISLLPASFPTSNYKEKKCFAFSLLRNTQPLHQDSIWFGNESMLVHFPMQTAQSSTACTHGFFLFFSFAGKHWGNRLVKVLPFFIWMKLGAYFWCSLCKMTLKDPSDLRTSLFSALALHNFSTWKPRTISSNVRDFVDS